MTHDKRRPPPPYNGHRQVHVSVRQAKKGQTSGQPNSIISGAQRPHHARPPKRKRPVRPPSSWSSCQPPSCLALSSLAIFNGFLVVTVLQVWIHFKVLRQQNQSLRLSIPSSASGLLLMLHEQMSSIDVDGASSGKNQSRLVFRHKRRRDRSIKQPNRNNSFIPVALPLKHPVLVVGLPKAGTSSIFEFFTCLDNHRGYWEGQHWYCCNPQDGAQNGGPHYMSECMMYNLQQGLPILDGCGDFDLYGELNGPRRQGAGQQHLRRQRRSRGLFLPQRYHLSELHEYDPNSIWILNQRPVDDWVDSVLHMDIDEVDADALEAGQGHRVQDSHREAPGVALSSSLAKQLIEEVQAQETQRGNRQYDIRNTTKKGSDSHLVPTPKGRMESRRFLHDFYTSHVDRVREFAQSVQHHLIEVNITSSEAGLDLIRELGWLQYDAVTTARELEDRAKSCWGQHNEGHYHLRPLRPLREKNYDQSKTVQ